ncbi:Phosphomannomutase [hydrothermal vent metagenome]|uniref:Phosphomannomutase n=1 Tax=hydrothermal vent metagenome TaxID=652676 RepID=A0A3B1C4I1_9ZZZZ
MIRLQGTDGVRRPVQLSTDPSLNGLSPVESFAERGVITEQFVELYCFCRVRSLIESGAIEEGEPFVIGWDPRDPGGVYTNAAVQGLLKGGVDVMALGVAPTPLAPLYSRYIGAAGAVVITASHNPPAYNGIKIFTRHGLKLLPSDDIELSGKVMETGYDEVKNAPVKGSVYDRSGEALDLFEKYSLDPLNSWITDGGALLKVTLIVDAANGALSVGAGRILEKAGFGEVIVTSDRLDGSVNLLCGVAELEGIDEATVDMVAEGGRLSGNEAMLKLFETGRKKRESIIEGSQMVCAALFDGDGDRFYRVDYDPFKDVAAIMTGDETSVLQALFHADSERPKLFINTVESDLSASVKAAQTGYRHEITEVGDKWILLKTAVEILKHEASEKVGALIKAQAESPTVSADAIEKILRENNVRFAAPSENSVLIIGAEESGHNITVGYLETAQGEKVAVFHGNGLKSLLNTFAAGLRHEDSRLSAQDRFSKRVRPYPRGFKKTWYAYYVNKSLWQRGSDVWMETIGAIKKEVEKLDDVIETEEKIFPGELDMLYISIETGDFSASVYVRNSGTENKTGVNVRGPYNQSDILMALGEAVLRALTPLIKDMSDPMAVAEMELIEKTSVGGGAPADPLCGLSRPEYEQLLKETGVKQGYLTGAFPGSLLSDRGKWYLESIKRVKKVL